MPLYSNNTSPNHITRFETHLLLLLLPSLLLRFVVLCKQHPGQQRPSLFGGHNLLRGFDLTFCVKIECYYKRGRTHLHFVRHCGLDSALPPLRHGRYARLASTRQGSPQSHKQQ